MAEHLSILPSNLILDQENPRLVKANEGQRDAPSAIGKSQQRKLLALARDIIEYGLSPSDLPIVMPAKGDKNRYIVLEGNRRLAALKSLENPDSMVGAADPSVLKELRDLSHKYQEEPIDLIQCAVVKNQQEARHWIELRHTGENQGAGVVPWDSQERHRFLARTGAPDIVLQALDFAEEQGSLSPEKRSKVPATSLKRLLGTPEVREKLGLSLENGALKIMADKESVAKAIAHVASDLASGTTKTGDIYTREQRAEYAEKLPKAIAVTPTLRTGRSVSDGSAGKARQKPRKPKKARARDYLIPHDCVLNVSDERCRDIESELRTLSLDNHPNAISVLFRVFIELSADCYIVNRPLHVPPSKGASEPSLALKLKACAADLLARKKLDADQVKPVERACQKDSFLAPSVLLMNSYIHSRSMFPAPGDLRANWSSLQPFVIGLWSP